jgi:hypothetical protein
MQIYQRFLWPISYLEDQEGITLVMTLMFIAVLTIVGATAVAINSTDLLLGGAFHASQIAFHNADAGVNFVISRIPALVADHQLKLDGTELTESYAFETPSSFVFDVAHRSTFQRIADTRKYLLQVTGRSRPKSPITHTVEVVLQRRRALDYGLFAADRLDLPAQGRIYSYDSRRLNTHDAPTTSTHAVQIAANGTMTAQARHLDLGIDGDITLGMTPSGAYADFAFRESAPTVPPPPVQITTGEQHQIHLLPGDALQIDPLGIDKMVHDAQKTLRDKNDNSRALENHNNRITSSFYLNKGDYYLKDITLGSHAQLTLDASHGDIKIYVGSITFKDHATLNVMTDRAHGNVEIYLGGPASFLATSASVLPTVNVTGDASTFRIFSNSSEPIALHHDGDFKGLVYAPHAPVSVQNASAHGYGLLWAYTLDFSQNDRPYTFYVDTALQELFLAREVEMVSWKELRY